MEEGSTYQEPQEEFRVESLGTQPGHRGTTPRQVARPDQIITHTPGVCATCDAALDKEERTREIGLTFESFDPTDRLTRRETEVLQRMAGGYSNREIAVALELSEGRAVLKAIEIGYI